MTDRNLNTGPHPIPSPAGRGVFQALLSTGEEWDDDCMDAGGRATHGAVAENKTAWVFNFDRGALK
jgi:hypothetical protein